jgi:adenosylcobinamide-GDP ribazoletransferase
MDEAAPVGTAPRQDGLRAVLRGLRAAVTLLTRIPVGGFPYSDAEWRWSAAHLPAVGAFLGCLYGGVWLACTRAGDLVAAAVVTTASLLATGAIHEDGLADTADALGGGRTRERVLAILKDSRIGAFGGAAIAMTLVLRVALLARLGQAAPVVLVFTAAASRLVPVWLMAALPYVTDPSVAKSSSVATAGRPQVLVATAWMAAVTGAIGATHAFTGTELALVWVVALAVALACGRVFKSRTGGITGDFLGAAQQVSECAMLLALAIARGGPP